MELLIVIVLGIFLFCFIGVISLLGRTKDQSERLSELEHRLEHFEWVFKQSQKKPGPAETAVPAESPLPKIVEPPPVISEPVPEPAPQPVPVIEDTTKDTVKDAVPDTVETPVPAEETAEAEESAEPPAWIQSLGNFIRGGNLWAAGGVLLLIAAFGMLIAFLARRGFFTVEMGIIGAAVSGMVMLFFGWRFRARRRVFCLLLQGGGIGILYLAVFAAHKLTPYFPPLLSIILMTLLMAPAIVLALLQNSQALALLGFFGGFAAPILLASDEGSHIFLFSYYLVFNVGVLVIGYFRSWKWLNLMAFICTFATTLVWVMGSYNQSLFWTTEPFCIAFILVFTALGILSLRNPNARGFDIPVIVGTPVVGAVLQWNLVSHILYGHAIVSIAFSALYIALSVGVWRWRERLSTGSARPLAEAYLALSVLLANVAIPLLLSAQATSAVWAAEGAVLLLVGLRLKNVQTIIWGFIVHVAGAAAFWAGTFGNAYQTAAFRSPQFAGALIVAVSALAMVQMLNKFAERQQVRYPLDNPDIPRLLAIWACVWWFGGWLFELIRITGRSFDGSFFGLSEPWGIFFLLCSISAVIFFVVARLFRYPWLNIGAIPSMVTAVLLVFKNIFVSVAYHPARFFSYNFFDGEHLWAWIVFFAVEITLLIFLGKKINEDEESTRPTIHAGWIFTIIIIAIIILSSSGRALTAYLKLSESWNGLPSILPSLAVLLALIILARYVTNIPKLHGKLLFTALPLILCCFLGLWFFVTLILPATIIIFEGIGGFATTRFFAYNFFRGEYLWAWIAFFGVETALLIHAGKKITESGVLSKLHAAWIFTGTLIAIIVLSSSGRALTVHLKLAASWTSFAGILPSLAALLVAAIMGHTERVNRYITEVLQFNRTLLFTVLPLILCGFLGLWFFVTLFMPGNPDPLPLYIPVINPLDLQQGFCIAGILFLLVWKRKIAAPWVKDRSFILGDIAVFLWVTAIIARSVYFYGKVPMTSMARSPAFHLGILIFWGLYGIVHIIAGHKTKLRPLWIAGAILTVVDIAKLLIWDLAGTAPVIRIISFFVAGLILLFIGWVAPLPPSAASQAATAPEEPQ